MKKDKHPVIVKEAAVAGIAFKDAIASESIDGEQSIVGWGSRPTIDRDKELIESSAWKLDNYRKNPVLLLCHKYDVPPVGKVLWVKSDQNGLKFKAKFANTERGKECYELYKDGIMNAFSVGFKPRPGGVMDNPTDVKYKGCKRVFTDVELMEISCVPVPANSDALIDHVKSGKIHTKQLQDELEFVLEITEKGVIEKIEVGENYIHVPTDEAGDHKDHKIRTIAISKKEGIEALYCVDCKAITSYMFDKEKWDKEKAVKWVDDHKKDFIGNYFKDTDVAIFGIAKDAGYLDDDGDAVLCKMACPVEGGKFGESNGKFDECKDCELAKPCAKAKLEEKKNDSTDEKESVEDHIKGLFPEADDLIKAIDDLSALAEKGKQVDDLQSTIKSLEAQVAEVVSPSTKTTDSDGMPSLYDLTSAVDRALNYVDGGINKGGKCVVDIFATQYPSGHVVYSVYQEGAPSKYYQINYSYDITTRTASVSGTPEEVLQSWVADRYFIDGKSGDAGLDNKSERLVSVDEMGALSECSSKMRVALEAIDSFIAKKEVVVDTDFIEVIEKEPETIDIDDGDSSDDTFEIDEEMIKKAVTDAVKSNTITIDTKGMAEEIVAKLKGKATL